MHGLHHLYTYNLIPVADFWIGHCSNHGWANPTARNEAGQKLAAFSCSYPKTKLWIYEIKALLYENIVLYSWKILRRDYQR